MSRRTYSDAQLELAISGARSWRGVLRTLGLTATSSGAMRSVRHRADELDLDYTHFTGQRRWTDQELADAVASSRTWTEAADRLGLLGGSSSATLKGHALRLGLATDHLGEKRRVASEITAPAIEHLPRAGSLLAAAWFTLCGREVAWPLEPCPYGLLVWHGGTAERVQVKTTSVRTGDSWIARISQSSGKGAYDPDDIDLFFVIDGNLTYYLIPVGVVGGLTAIQMSAYLDYQVGSAAPLT